MFDKIEYKTTWCDSPDEMAKADFNCPKCEQANIKISQYNPAEKYCPVCKWKWKISKFPKKQGSPLGEVKEFCKKESSIEKDVIDMSTLLDNQVAMAKELHEIWLYVQSRK